VNLAWGRGWQSTTWFEQPRGEFFVGNQPIYPLLVSAWVKVFGVSPTSIRSISYVTAALASAGILFLLGKHGLVRQRCWLLLTLVVMLGGYGLVFSYRSARYDMLGELLCVMALMAMSVRATVAKYALLILLGAAIALTGLQLLPLMAAVALIALIAYGTRRMLIPFLVLGVAMGATLGIWLAVLKQIHVFDAFVRSVTAVSEAASGARGRLREVVGSLGKDPSTAIVAAILVIFCIVAWRQKRLRRSSPEFIGLLSVTLLPMFVAAAGKFPAYYAWMKYCPGVAFCVAALSVRWPEQSWRVGRWVAVALLLVSGMGLPIRLGFTALEWNKRSYRPVHHLAQLVNTDDYVFCHEAAYYPVKERARELFTTLNLPKMSAEDRARITVLIIPPADLDRTARGLGGHWELECDDSDDSSVAQYRLALYRRTAPPPAMADDIYDFDTGATP
jgi:hypothetical protein